jgi:hypothetical protein
MNYFAVAYLDILIADTLWGELGAYLATSIACLI